MGAERVNENKQKLQSLTHKFSQKYLNEEYDEVIVKLIEAMSRKKNVLFATGKIENWATGVIHALGTINFLFDKASEPYVTVKTINDFFGTKQSTTSQKSKKIRDLFQMTYFDDTYAIRTVAEKSPLSNLISVNGLLVPIGRTKSLIEVDESDKKAAEIIGVTELKDVSEYEEQALDQLLKVNDESLLSALRSKFTYFTPSE